MDKYENLIKVYEIKERKFNDDFIYTNGQFYKNYMYYIDSEPYEDDEIRVDLNTDLL